MMKTTLKMILTFVFAFTLFTTTQAQPQTEENTPKTASSFRLVDKPGEIVETLPNGLVAIIKENHIAPVAAVRLYVRTGSIYEEEYLGAGMSHLFEHLLAGGETKNHTEEDSRRIIQETGARFNAFTSKAMTCYYLTVPAQHIGTAMSLISDWVTRPTFPEASFNREWGVVQRELEMNISDPDRQLWSMFDQLRYKIHPAKYPIIGHQKIVQQLTNQVILDYYKERYVPDNCILSVVGDFNAEEMLTAVKKEYADFSRRALPNIVLPEEPEVIAPRELVKVFPSLSGPARMIIGFPSFDLLDPDLYAFDTLAQIMGKGLTSRLYRSLYQEKQLVYSISSANFTPHYADGTFMITCAVAPDKVQIVKQAIWDEIDKLKKEGVTTDELDRAKRILQVNHIRSNQTAVDQASTMAEDYLATGDPHFSDNYVSNMQKVTAQQVQSMANKYFLPNKQLTLVITPVPLSTNKSADTKETAKSKIKKITLDNGLRILLKRDPSVPLVNTQLFTLGGLLDETDANNGITSAMTTLAKKGTVSYNEQEISEFFDNIGASMSASAGNNTVSYTMETMSDDFANAFPVFSEIVLQPTFPQEELTKLKPRMIAQIQQVKNSWRAEGNRFFRENFFTNSPYKRTTYGTIESVEKMSREDLINFHKSVLNGSRSVIAVFGDIDLAQTEQIIRKQFASLPKGNPFDTAQFKPEPPITQQRKFVEKTEKLGATVDIGFPGMKMTNIEDRYPMQVLTEIIGSNNGWLHEGLRGQGLVYYAWVLSFPGITPGYVNATTQCEAENVPRVVGLIREYLTKAQNGGITEKELLAGKNNIINSEILRKQTNADTATAAALDELYGFGYDWSDGLSERIMAVTLADIQRVAKDYLSKPETISINTSQPDLVKDI